MGHVFRHGTILEASRGFHALMKQDKPLTLCEEYARRKSWRLLRANFFVEGTSDVRYFSLASELYEQEKSKSILGRDCAVLAIGQGDDGGTFGMSEQFPTFLQIVKADPDEFGKNRFRVLSLLDYDKNGRSAAQGMCKSNRSILENKNVFLLRFHMPRRSRDAGPLTNHIKSENAACSTLDCEVEDLLAESLLLAYLDTAPSHLKCKQTLGNETHREWNWDGKDGLLKFTEQYANLSDLTKIVETIKSIRFYLGLPPDGIP